MDKYVSIHLFMSSYLLDTTLASGSNFGERQHHAFMVN